MHRFAAYWWLAPAWCAAYWYHAAQELGVPGWMLAGASLGAFYVMQFAWPGSWWAAFGLQVAGAIGIAVIRAIRMSVRPP